MRLIGCVPVNLSNAYIIREAILEGAKHLAALRILEAEAGRQHHAVVSAQE
jgi:hypothetical protein